MANSSTAIAVTGWNRPRYFQPTIASVLANAQIECCDLWFFFDGGPVSSQAECRQIADEELAKSKYSARRVTFIERDRNFGCGRNLIDARRLLFDVENYDRVLLFEDDMVVSPHYIALAERLLDWASANFSDIGAAQPYHACHMPVEEKVCRADEVIVGNSHWWGYLMPRQTWHKVRDTLYEYEEKFLNQVDDYEKRDHMQIRQWGAAKLRSALKALSHPFDIFCGPRRFPGCWDFIRYYGHYFHTSQDAITALAMTLAGLQKINCVVNRGLPIGAKGLHSTPRSFQRKRLDQIVLHNFPSDAVRTSFRAHSTWERPLKPLMRADEIEAIRLLIDERRPRRVLEFGAGGSTVTFPREAGVKEWWSLEHSMKWIAQVASTTPFKQDCCSLLLTCPAAKILERLETLLETGFDMFFVDGFDRPSILRRLRDHLLRAPGFVLLHDAMRPHYQEAIELFPVRRTLAPGTEKHQGLMLLEVPR